MIDCSSGATRRKACPHEGAVIDGKKSYCEMWGRWTNCREAGRCVYRERGKGARLISERARGDP